MIPSHPIHLVYAADGGFAMPLAVSLYSVLRRLTPARSAWVHIVDGGFSSRQKRRIGRVAERGAGDRGLQLDWVKPRPEWWGGVKPDFSGKHLNETVLYRLGIPHFLPADADRAIYLDADVLAKTDIAALEVEIPADGGLAAVTDYGMPNWRTRFWGKTEPLGELQLDGDEPYFNAGILGINVTYWREHEVAARAARFLEVHTSRATFYDQDALNYVLRGCWKALHPGWNFPPTCRDKLSRRGRTVEQCTGLAFEELHRDAKMIHFTGAKPWDQGFTNPERPTFTQELRASGWFGPVRFAIWSANWYRRLLARLMRKQWVFCLKPRMDRFLWHLVDA